MRRALLLGATLAGLVTTGSVARAEDLPRSLDLPQLFDQGLGLLSEATKKRVVTARDARAAVIAEQEALFPSRDVALRDWSVDALGSPTYGFGRPRIISSRAIDVGPYRNEDRPGESLRPPIRMTLVARDWKGGIAIKGNGLMPTDQMRLARSMRMLVGRITIGDGPLVPFVHMGIGEWRYDPDFLPYHPRNQEYAAQVSMGLRLRLAERAALAWEADYTLLVRERREPQNHPSPSVVSSFGVLQVGF